MPISNTQTIPWQPVMMGLQKEPSVRVIAVDRDGERLPDANLCKFLANGTLYLYHTINPGLGFTTDAEGRLPLL